MFVTKMGGFFVEQAALTKLEDRLLSSGWVAVITTTGVVLTRVAESSPESITRDQNKLANLEKYSSSLLGYIWHCQTIGGNFSRVV
jgi:hypothetical protein